MTSAMAKPPPVFVSKPPDWGFTLLELLVVMALMSLLMLGMASALRTMGQTEDRIDLRLSLNDEFRVATGFVGEILGRISTRKAQALSEQDSLYLFDGTAQTVSWLGVMPARYGVGGRFFFRLALEPVKEKMAVVIRFAPWNEAEAFPDWSQAQSRVLVTDVTKFALSYEDQSVEPYSWSSVWTRKKALPSHIRVSIAARSIDWPLWIIATRSIAQGGQAAGGYSTGPQ